MSGNFDFGGQVMSTHMVNELISADSMAPCRTINVTLIFDM